MPKEYKYIGNGVNKNICLTDYNIVCKFACMELGERLKLARKHAKLSQIALAEKSGVSQQTISNIENGIQDKSTDVVQLAIACGVRCEWLAIESGDMCSEPYPTAVDTPESKVLLAMQHMDETTKYQLLKISNSLAEPQSEEHNSHRSENGNKQQHLPTPSGQANANPRPGESNASGKGNKNHGVQKQRTNKAA